jgi:hypothetical protein
LTPSTFSTKAFQDEARGSLITQGGVICGGA